MNYIQMNDFILHRAYHGNVHTEQVHAKADT
jgi:hypothetical protein